MTSVRQVKLVKYCEVIIFVEKMNVIITCYLKMQIMANNSSSLETKEDIMNAGHIIRDRWKVVSVFYGCTILR